MDQAKPAVLRTKAADQLAKRAGQVAVFVSRREKKIFVRQGITPGSTCRSRSPAARHRRRYALEPDDDPD
jgi:hypothetical protein